MRQKACAECQRLRLELAAIDERLQRYRSVAEREEVTEARREAVRTCGWVEARLSSLKNEQAGDTERARAEAREWLGLGSVAVDSDRDRQRSRSSMRTLFELRGRWWLLFPLSWALLLGAAALTWWLIKG